MESVRTAIRWITAAAFIAIGVLHFTSADLFVRIMPSALPYPLELVWISGVFEILGGIGLLLPFSRTLAGWGLLALLIAVFPANVNMAVNEVYLPIEWLPQSKTGLWMRLPFQLVIAAQVWFAMGPRSRRRIFWSARAEEQNLELLG